MPGADPNPIATHLEDDERHVTHAEIEALRAELLGIIAALPGGKAIADAHRPSPSA